MAIKKSDLYSSLWVSFGGMDDSCFDGGLVHAMLGGFTKCVVDSDCPPPCRILMIKRLNKA